MVHICIHNTHTHIEREFYEEKEKAELCYGKIISRNLRARDVGQRCPEDGDGKPRFDLNVGDIFRAGPQAGDNTNSSSTRLLVNRRRGA